MLRTHLTTCFFALSLGSALFAILAGLLLGMGSMVSIIRRPPFKAPDAAPRDPRASSNSSIAPGETAVALASIRDQFHLSPVRLRLIAEQMVADMERGLEVDHGAIKMLPTHVTKRPTGAETGSYLALDLGGTNFRVCEVTLDGTGGTTMVQSKFVIADDAKTGHGDALFDFIARCVFDFLKEHHGDEAEWVHVGKKLGFTFSFPVDQVSINEGSLLLWTKGFTATGVVGHDVVRLLQDAFKRLGLNIDVIALVNDTTGTLVSLAYTVPNTYIGCILGTGSNCAYVEEIRNVVKYKGASKGLSEMLINMEWGGFDDAQDVIPRTKYDLELDRATPTPGSWTFEQLISGMYLGEIVRLVLVDLVEAGFLFRENEGGSLELRARNAFDTAYMSRIESDNSKDLHDTKIILKDVFHIPQTTLTDRRIVRKVCKIVGLRSARLAGAGISAIATKMNRFHIVVGVDGSLFELYPHYGERMKDAIREVLGVERGNSVVLKQATDGSGIGAALIAALAGE